MYKCGNGNNVLHDRCLLAVFRHVICVIIDRILEHYNIFICFNIWHLKKNSHKGSCSTKNVSICAIAQQVLKSLQIWNGNRLNYWGCVREKGIITVCGCVKIKGLYKSNCYKGSFCTLHRPLADIMWCHSQFSSSQLEKCIVTSCYVGMRSYQSKEGPHMAVWYKFVWGCVWAEGPINLWVSVWQ